MKGKDEKVIILVYPEMADENSVQYFRKEESILETKKIRNYYI